MPQQAQPSWQLATAADMIGTTGCPLCRHADEATERFFRWFAAESYSDPPMIARLSASGGMCPAHTRRLIAMSGASSILTTVYGAVLPAVRAGASSAVLPDAPCPACQSVDRAHRSSTGLCVRHVAGWRGAGAVPALVVSQVTARLDMLAGELAIADRKRGWLARFEAGGPEATAWVRAAALLDGDVFLGGSPTAASTADSRALPTSNS